MCSSSPRILEQIPDPVLVLDDHFVLRAANSSAEQFFGYTREEFLGIEITRLIPPGVQHALAGTSMESEAIRRDGKRVPVDLHFGTSASPGGLTIVIYDISRWKAMEDDLRVQRVTANLSRMATNEFFVRITHSLKTPLHSIIGFSALLADETSGLLDDRHKRFVHHISEGGSRLQHLVDDLLALARAESGRFASCTDPVDLDVLIGRMLSLVADLAHEHRVEVSFEAAPDLPQISADENRLKTAIFNILDSAIQSSAEGGRLLVQTGRHGDSEAYVRFGISKTKTHVHNEEPAANASRDVSLYMQSFHRTGLGIPLAARFVEMHGGRLVVDNEDRGAGVSILITLPIVDLALSRQPQ
jgi:PAS domain S-box-containing protein